MLLARTVRIGSYSGPYFPAFRLKAERCRVSRRIQSEYGYLSRSVYYKVHESTVKELSIRK